MPQLLAFLPCSRVLVNEGDHSVSLIGILDRITITIPHGLTILPNTTIPTSWQIYTHWQQEPEDVEKTYQQSTYIVLPSGRKVLETLVDFDLPDRYHRNIGVMDMLPVGEEGDCFLCVVYREAGQEEWTQVGSFPLSVVHNFTPAGDEEAPSLSPSS